MTVTIHIPAPVLVGTQYFAVKYRLQGSPTWIDISPKTNSPFTIAGLVAGVYELWTQVGEGTVPDVLCDERIDTFTVSEDTSCFSYVVTMNNNGRLVTLNITYGLPSPFPPNLCSIQVTYIPVGSTAAPITVNFPPMIGSITLPATATSYNVTINQIGCDGNIVTCFDDEVEYEIPPCDHFIFENAILNIHPDNTFWITLNFTQSNPYTNPFNVAYDQANAVNSGIPDPGGALNLAAGPSTTSLIFQVFPNFDVVRTNGIQRYIYEGNITDRCGYSTKWMCFLDLS